MLEKVQAMLADALNLPLSKVTPDAKIVEDLGADSLDVVELLSRLEDEYGVVIPDDDRRGRCGRTRKNHEMTVIAFLQQEIAPEDIRERFLCLSDKSGAYSFAINGTIWYNLQER